MEDLTRLLEDTLSNDTNRRESSEARLTQSLSTPGFSVLLTQALQTPMQLPLAQLTALLLKKSVIASWEATEESTFVLADAEKAQVRNLLAHSLVQVAHGAAPAHFLDSKFQTAYSLVLAEIVKHDWPEKWPELLPSIMELMTTQAEFALKFFSVATDHIASDHFVDLVPLLFPHLERIFDAPTSSLRLKGRVVSVVQTCLTMLGMIAQTGEGTAGAVLQATVTPWIGRFVHVLQSADDGLSILVVRALTSFVVEWPKDMSSLIPSILPPVWQVLVGSVPQYEAQVVMAADTEGYDSDGASVGKPALTIELLDFIRGLVHAPTKKTRQLVTESLQPLIHTMVAYMQITQSQLELWNEEPNQYVADEDDDSLKHNVRNTGADLLRELETSLGASVLAATVQATQQRLAEPSWRMQEAALLVMGSLAEPLLMARSGSSAVEGLDLPQFLTTLFDVMHASESNIYLKARALWCASRFATAMTETQLNAFIQVAVSGLDRTQVIPVKLYACRALGTFAQHEKADTLMPQYVVDVIHRLLQLTSEATTDTLHVVLETLALVVVVPGSDAALQPILETIVPLWVTNLNDRMVHDVIVDILSAILMQTDSASSAGVVLDHVVPTLGNVFSTIHVSQAIEVVELLVKQQNVAPLVVPVLFDPLLNILLTTDDGSVLTNGGDCLKWFVTYSSPQIHQFTCALPHTQGMNGVDGVMHVAAKLLSPSISDSGAMAVGGLVTQVLIHLSSVLPVSTIQQLLHAVSTRLAAAKMPSLIQSLCTVFARLIHSFGVPTILDTLDTLGVLPFVLTTWIEHQPDFYGMYAIKVTVLALVKLLDAQDPRVLSLVVKGEQVPDTSSGRTLRSQKKDKVYVQVSFATKLVGILAMTFAQFEVDGEEEAEDIDSEDDEEDDGEDEDDAVQNVRPGGPSSIFAPSENYLLSDMLDLGGEEDEEDDLEASMDPLNEVDLKAQITQVMQTLNSKPDFVVSVVPGLTAAEKSIIQDILS